MFKRILIPIDDTRRSERAGRFGLDLAKRIGADVVFAHVAYNQPIHGLEPEELDRRPYTNFGAKLLGRWADIGAQEDVRTDTRLAEGSDIAQVIVELARQAACELIVMGTHAREGLGRLLLGSVAERVARLAPQPVMLLRMIDDPILKAGFSRILVPLDGSVLANLALEYAADLATQLGSSLTLVHVIPDALLPIGVGTGLPHTTSTRDALHADLQQNGERIVQDALAGLKLFGAENLSVRTRVVDAGGQDVGSAIIGVAAEDQTDLIVIGTHGRHGLDRLLLGSVAERVAHHAQVPVMLVRAIPVRQGEVASEASHREVSSAFHLEKGAMG